MNDMETVAEPRMSTLVTGIVHDVEKLVKQQLSLFRSELEQDVRKARVAFMPLGLGVWGVLMGIASLGLMLVHLLHWATEIPLWGCFGLVGVICAALGAALTYVGLKTLESVNPLRDESAQALKENVECLMNPK